MTDLVLIGVDWGTTSLRASGFDADGRILERKSSTQGIMSVEGGRFDPVLVDLIGDWQRSAGKPVPVVLSGMITSRNGWVETPYLPVPCSLRELATRLVGRRSDNGWSLWFVPGVSQVPEPDADGNRHDRLAHDIMRGEETELFGQLASTGRSGGWFVLPGTHSKWVRLEGGTIRGFVTFMTGEVYQALCAHTLLGRLIVPNAPFDESAFRAGVVASSRSNRSLLAQLFSVRAMPLLGALPAESVRDYLAGLLIGSELSDGLKSFATPVEITNDEPGFVAHGPRSDASDPKAGSPLRTPVLVGRGDLVTRYRLAFRELGLEAEEAEPDCAARGLFEIARLAGSIIAARSP